MIILSILTILFLSGTVYFAYRGLITDSEDFYDSVANTNQYMYKRIIQTHDRMKQIDRIGAFEKDDEAGTTFSLLKEVIDELKEEFDAKEEEKK